MKYFGINLAQKEEIVKILREAIKIEENNVKVERVRHGRMTRNNIWKVHSEDGFTAKSSGACRVNHADGKRYIVKQFIVPLPERYSQISVEANILKLLKLEGCPVPDVIGIDESNQVIVLEWRGDITWDDLCQDETIVDKKRYIKLAIEGFCHIERVFSENASLVEPYVYPLDYKLHLRQIGENLLASARSCISDLAWIRGEPLTESETKIVDEAWNEISHCILKRQPTLGTLDYNARNIIIDRNRLSFIDFAKIGWDWSERRLMQYLTGLGAHIEGGNFVTLLDLEHTRLYSETMSRMDVTLNWQKIAALVDYHHILFYLTAIIRLLNILKNPESRQSILLSKAWGPVKPRMTKALFNLAHESLSNDEAAMAIRHLFLSFADKVKS